MKKLLFLAPAALLLTACGSGEIKEWQATPANVNELLDKGAKVVDTSLMRVKDEYTEYLYLQDGVDLYKCKAEGSECYIYKAIIEPTTADTTAN